MGLQQEVLLLPCQPAAFRYQGERQTEKAFPFGRHGIVQIGRKDAAALGQGEGDSHWSDGDEGSRQQYGDGFILVVEQRKQRNDFRI